MLHIVTRWNCKTSNYLLYSIIIYPILESGNKVEGRHTFFCHSNISACNRSAFLRILRVLFFGEGRRLGEDRLQLFSLWFNTCLFILCPPHYTHNTQLIRIICKKYAYYLKWLERKKHSIRTF